MTFKKFTLPLAVLCLGARLLFADSLYPNYNTDPEEPDFRGMGKSAVEIAAEINLGWNIGNTMEAMGGETAWGNPQVSEELIQLVKASGFDAVRIPCSWDQYANQETAEIDAEWLDRVKTVVQYCLDADLYVALNIHWDGGWLERNIETETQEAVNAKQKAFWEQIATHFREFDGRLLFASANEPHVENEAQMEVLMSFHQTFIDTVRATGGRNAFRVLIVQGPITDIEKTDTLMDQMPVDTIPGRLMAELHYYTPYNFALMQEDQSWGKQFYYWGKDFHSNTDVERNATWGEEETLLELFATAKAQFVDKGIPVLLGEFGAQLRMSLPEGADFELHRRSRNHYLNYVTKQANAHGFLPFYWDTGTLDGFASGLFDRDSNVIGDQEGLDALLEGAKDQYWAELSSSEKQALKNSDGDWANDRFEFLVGSDASSVESVPERPSVSVDELGRLVLSVARISPVRSELELWRSGNLLEWSNLPVETDLESDTVLRLLTVDALSREEASFFKLRIPEM
ncbi:glycoside hydrolase family 5 protein [Pelagicoccus mobilis]|uniref:Glycoside hydrolase family 5 protein n=1 Tax=Pelagicoccus mobilis TaxID=415221 RepID=A0A934S1W3_9BACT|nr:glycoside hydrolase family 5 protein [Pelagicoccus mobilis]MBK1878337.1 glycoside hydrolase family 5 protein [Pelagicoccus mobilis]